MVTAMMAMTIKMKRMGMIKTINKTTLVEQMIRIWMMRRKNRMVMMIWIMIKIKKMMIKEINKVMITMVEKMVIT
jgi:hypothetical protein